jgi:hypothetical protein
LSLGPADTQQLECGGSRSVDADDVESGGTDAINLECGGLPPL